MLFVTAFTLQEEARNTERHHQSFWDSDQRLRHSKVSFISAGPLRKPETEARDTESALAEMSLDSPPGEVEMEVEVEVVDELEVTNSSPQEESTTPHSGFVIDLYGGEIIKTGLPPPHVRVPSPTPSDSSEEIILFGGRNNQGKGLSGNTQSSRPLTNPVDAKIRIVEGKIHEQKELLEEALRRKKDSSSILQESAEPSSGEFEAILPARRSKNHRQGRRDRRSAEKAEEEAIIADYLANIDAEDNNAFGHTTFKSRELGGSENDAWEDETGVSSGEPLGVSRERVKGEWVRSNIEDLDDLSTSDGVMGEVQAIFSKRERENGLQYLVVWEDQTMDDARWVPASTLAGIGAQSRIEEFEAEEKLVAQFSELSDEDDDDSDDSDDIGIEDVEDNEDLIQRRIERMDDDQIARLLAKQEELGMGSNELLLFDDDADADEDEEFAISRTKFSPIMLASKKTRAKRPRGEFPAATALADAYDGFDVMDFDRPSLRRSRKVAKANLSLMMFLTLS